MERREDQLAPEPPALAAELAVAAAPVIVAVSDAHAPTVVAAPTTDHPPVVLAPVSPTTEAAAAGEDDLESYLQGILDGPSGEGGGAEDDDDDDDDEVRSPRLRRATAAGGLSVCWRLKRMTACTAVCCLNRACMHLQGVLVDYME